MVMSKSEWLEKTAHINAQSAAWFFLFCLIVVGVAIWRDMSKETKDNQTKEKK